MNVETQIMIGTQIVKAVATTFDLDPRALLVKTRKPQIFLARQTAAYLMTWSGFFTQASAASALRYKTHSTVTKARKTILARSNRDPQFLQQLCNLRSSLMQADTKPFAKSPDSALQNPKPSQNGHSRHLAP